MQVRFWGTRGSLPVAPDAGALRAKVRAALAAARGHDLGEDAALDHFLDHTLAFPLAAGYGGNSSCVEIRGGEEVVICDAGSGLRALGHELLGRDPAPRVINLFQSHLHWDHIMGSPFFTPAYRPGVTVRIHGCHAELEEAFRRQQGPPSFPVPFGALGADIRFVRLEPGQPRQIAGMTVSAIAQDHGGDSYGYRFERGGKSVVYSTDAEHRLESEARTQSFVDFFRDADLVIFDAMYSLAEAISVKEDWGHSSNIVGVDLCHRAHVRRYCMFHHEPVYDDLMIHRVLEETRRYEELMREDHALEVMSAYDGLELDL